MMILCLDPSYLFFAPAANGCQSSHCLTHMYCDTCESMLWISCGPVLMDLRSGFRSHTHKTSVYTMCRLRSWRQGVRFAAPFQDRLMVCQLCWWHRCEFPFNTCNMVIKRHRRCDEEAKQQVTLLTHVLEPKYILRPMLQLNMFFLLRIYC